MSEQPEERRIETQFEIEAPVEDVWRALTDAEWLTNWFPPEARVTPGVGGSIWHSWGGEMEFEASIGNWEENKHLKLIHIEATPPDEVEEARKQGTFVPFQIALDYYLQGKGGSTTLRLVNSGFSDDAVWDTQYDGTVRGWQLELRGLKHYLERHRGVKRHVVKAVHSLEGVTLQDAWDTLLSAEGLCAQGSLAGLSRAIVTQLPLPEVMP